MIYLDNHATTPVDPRVREAVLPWLGERWGNAGSRSHAYGWTAEAAVTRAREQLAELLGAAPREIVFTSGATEAIHLGLLGVLGAADPARRRVVTTATEHHAVLGTCEHAAAALGAELVVVPVDRAGRVDPEGVLAAVTDATALVAVMAANNEVGTLQPVTEIARACRERGVPVFCDAAQAVGRVPVDVGAWGVDLLALSAHKFHGPQGVGALWIRDRTRIAPVMFGGGQERGLRPGTLNVPGIVGLGAAAAAARTDVAADAERIAGLRDRLQAALLAIDGAAVNGHPVHRLPGNLSVRFEGVEAEDVLLAMPQVAVSTGAACSSGTPAPSHVLRALGLSDAAARATIRFGLGRFTTESDVDAAADATRAAIRRVRDGVTAGTSRTSPAG